MTSFEDWVARKRQWLSETRKSRLIHQTDRSTDWTINFGCGDIFLSSKGFDPKCPEGSIFFGYERGDRNGHSPLFAIVPFDAPSVLHPGSHQSTSPGNCPPEVGTNETVDHKVNLALPH